MTKTTKENENCYVSVRCDVLQTLLARSELYEKCLESLQQAEPVIERAQRMLLELNRENRAMKAELEDLREGIRAEKMKYFLFGLGVAAVLFIPVTYEIAISAATSH